MKRNLRSNLYNLITKKDSRINENSVLGHLYFIKDIEPDYYEKMLVYINKLRKTDGLTKHIAIHKTGDSLRRKKR